ncbi:MAG: monofunctional biosynthetic peptidoglycan transglycosylase [Gemmatimonadota bacterium]
MRSGKTVRLVLAASGGVLLLWVASIGASLLFLPSVAPLKDPRKSYVVVVKDWKRANRPFVLGPRNRWWTPIGAIPSSMRKAVVAAEDANFYSHDGVDYDAMKAALKTDIEKRRFARGGSTITQQLAKNVFLSREKTISRKIKEVVLAWRIDDTLSKSRILELYLNVVELGPMVFGVGHASQYYFGKAPSALTIRESAFLAAMLPGPRIYDPYRKMGRVMRRSDTILRHMFAARMIAEEEYRAALAETPNIAGLTRKVETTIASPPPPEEKPPPTAPGDGIEVVGSDAGPGEASGTPPETSPGAPGSGEPDEPPSPAPAGGVPDETGGPPGGAGESPGGAGGAPGVAR